MVKKITKYLKFVVCCALIMSLVAPSYAALSASDGSAFVTKAEFDSALADFNARLTTFEAGINSKIDSQVTSYLDRNGIWNGQEVTFATNKNETKLPVSFQASNVDNTGMFTSTYGDEYMMYWIWKYGFTTSTQGNKAFYPIKLIDNVSKSGLLFLKFSPFSKDSGRREGVTTFFPWLDWQQGYNNYAVIGLAKPQLGLSFVFSNESHGLSTDSITFNEQTRTQAATFAWAPVETYGLASAVIGTYVLDINMNKFQLAPGLRPTEDPDWVKPGVSEMREDFQTKAASLGISDWKVSNGFDGKNSLLFQPNLTPTWLQFFVKKGEDVWMYFDLSWSYMSTRQFQVWSASANYAISMGIGEGKNLRAKLDGAIY